MKNIQIYVRNRNQYLFIEHALLTFFRSFDICWVIEMIWVFCIFSGLLTFLGVVDLYFVDLAYYSTLVKGASVQLVFGFEVNMIHVPITTKVV